MNTPKRTNPTKRTILVSIVVAAVIAITVVAFAATQGDQKSSKTLVAANLPLTGKLAVYGKPVQRGVTMALEELKKKGELASEFEFDWQDNAGKPQTAISIMQRQYLTPPSIYVSGVLPQTLAIWGEISKKGTPHFVWIFNMFINQNSNNNLRTWVNAKIEADLYLGYAEKIKAKTVSMVYCNFSVFVEEFEKVVIPGLKNRGVNVESETFGFEETEFKTIAQKVKKQNPDLIVLAGFQDHMVGLIRALRPLGLVKDGNVIGSYDMLDAAELLGPDELEGVCCTAPRFVTRKSDPLIADWIERFRKRYNREPIYTDAYGYDMMTIINDSAKRLALPPDSKTWIEALRATNIKDGITGPLVFDSDGSLKTPVEVAIFRDGRILPE